MLAGLLLWTACQEKPLPPGLHVGTPGSAEACTLGEERDRFAPGDPLAFVLRLDRPFGVEQVTLQALWLDQEGTPRKRALKKLLGVLRDHRGLCVVDPQLTAGEVMGAGAGPAALRVIAAGQLLGEARFEVVGAQEAQPAKTPPPASPEHRHEPGEHSHEHPPKGP